VALLLAKQRLGSLSPAITGNKKLYRNNKYDSNTENKVHKLGANVGFAPNLCTWEGRKLSNQQSAHLACKVHK
jgi:hypothetical protein